MKPKATIFTLILIFFIATVVVVQRLYNNFSAVVEIFQNQKDKLGSLQEHDVKQQTFDGIARRYVVILDEKLPKAEMSQHIEKMTKSYEAMKFELQQEKGNQQFFLEERELELVTFEVGKFLTGYSGYFYGNLLKELQESSEIKILEPEQTFHTNEVEVEEDSPWGLDRVSHRELDTSGEYIYDSDAGLGVNVYIVDTGIKTEHEEFEGRASWGKAVALPHLEVDGNGHGTHCAGIVGSKTYGITKKANLIAVGVMNFLGAGSTSDIIKGLEFVVQDHQKNVESKEPGFKGSVINLSLGGGVLDALDLAVNAATQAGVHVAVAAGNDDKDACSYSPARAVGPLTIGATNSRDEKASFSNFGSCVDVFAPGEDILSTYIWQPTASMSGTSMASPHVAGLLAYFLSLTPTEGSEFAMGNVDPTLLKTNVLKYATKNALSGLDGLSPNLLIYNGAGSGLKDFWGSK